MNELSQSINEAMSKKLVCFLSAERYDLTFETMILDYRDAVITLKNTIPFVYISAVMSANPYYLQCNREILKAETLESNGCDIIFVVNEFSLIRETRGEDRQLFGPGSETFLEILNPFDQETYIVKTVLDLSDSGVSVITHYRSKLFSPGVKIDSMVVNINGNKLPPKSGTIIYVRNYVGIDGKLHHQVGIKFLGTQ